MGQTQTSSLYVDPSHYKPGKAISDSVTLVSDAKGRLFARKLIREDMMQEWEKVRAVVHPFVM